MELSKFLNKYKRNKKDVYTPSLDLINLCEELKNHEILSIYYEDFKAKIYDESSRKNDFDIIISEINKTNTEYANKIFLKEMLSIEIENLNQISNLNIDKNYKDLNTFKESMQVIKEEKQSLEKLNKQSKLAFEDEQTKKIKVLFNNHFKELNKALKEINDFNTQEEKLSDEILNYSYEITKLKQKYKLSIDWNGNKKQMIIRGNELKAERYKLVEKENILNDKCKKLYNYIILMHTNFTVNHMQIFSKIEKEIELLKVSIKHSNSIALIESKLSDYINLYY